MPESVASTKICERCGDEYEGYMVLIRDNLSDLVGYLRGEYDDLCKPCRAAVHPHQAFEGATDVSPNDSFEGGSDDG